ncbi:hypothetical protein Scep_011929 [Stephania cephalantha]|uniref:Uncharacterized protein n=1 Tax=Stephania cephalantha TaxID=152367 RepID=A0AAP0P9E8_9MAGN
MDCTIGLEDGVRRVLEEEIKEIHDSKKELSKEDIIDCTIEAKVLEEGMIFDTLDEVKLAWVQYARSLGFVAKLRSWHRKRNVLQYLYTGSRYFDKHRLTE